MKKFRKLVPVLVTVLSLLVVGVVSVSAQTSPMSATAYVSSATELMTDLGIFPIIVATAIVGLALFLFRKARSASR